MSESIILNLKSLQQIGSMNVSCGINTIKSTQSQLFYLIKLGKLHTTFTLDTYRDCSTTLFS